MRGCGCYSSFAGNARKNGKAVRLSEGRSVLRPDHEPLYVLGAQVLLVKAQRPQVPVEVAVCVARGPLGYCPPPLDYQGTIACFPGAGFVLLPTPVDRKSTRLNSSHANISYAVFCLKK